MCQRIAVIIYPDGLTGLIDLIDLIERGGWLFYDIFTSDLSPFNTQQDIREMADKAYLTTVSPHEVVALVFQGIKRLVFHNRHSPPHLMVIIR